MGRFFHHDQKDCSDLSPSLLPENRSHLLNQKMLSGHISPEAKDIGNAESPKIAGKNALAKKRTIPETKRRLCAEWAPCYPDDFGDVFLGGVLDGGDRPPIRYGSNR